ncbi:MAG: fibronectin type III domain-containing protein [Candidatus Hodarchaeota archaeon]
MWTKPKKEKTLAVLFLVFILFLLGSIQFCNETNNFNNTSSVLTFDFEDNVADWDPVTLTKNSNFNVDDNFAVSGNKSARLVGTTTYNYNISKNHGKLIHFTNNTTISFSWRFENKDASYIGIIVRTSGPNLYITSLFWGTYANISRYLVIQYYGEEINTWHQHMINMSRLYLDVYESIPANITSISLINKNSNGGTHYDSVQITNFDAISFDGIKTSNISIQENNLLYPNLLYPNGGEILKGTVVVQWTAVNSSSEDSVTYAVSYSSDSGLTWNILTLYHIQTYYLWDTTTVPDGSNYRVKVVAISSEGWNSTDISGTFTIQNNSSTSTTTTSVHTDFLTAEIIVLVFCALFLRIRRQRIFFQLQRLQNSKSRL